MMACSSTNSTMCVLLRFNTLFSLIVCRDYVPLVNLIGVYFQIRDDLMNLQSAEVGSFISCLHHPSANLLHIYSIQPTKASPKTSPKGNFHSPSFIVSTPIPQIVKFSTFYIKDQQLRHSSLILSRI